MQIRLTVLAPRSGHPTRACDVLVTAPAGTALATVASGLAAAVAGSGADIGASGSGSSGKAGGAAGAAGGPVVLYAGTDRLDPQRAAVGEPPLIDGAVLSLGAPGPAPAHGLPHGAPRLRVVSGPDAGGVHLLHGQGGAIRVGRSAQADVPLDDPDVSRLHCAVTVEPDGSVLVADLRSTNGTAVGGAEVGEHPVPLPPGALLRIGESALRLTPAPAEPDPALVCAPDGEGRLRVSQPEADAPGADGGPPRPGLPAARPGAPPPGTPDHRPPAAPPAAPEATGPYAAPYGAGHPREELPAAYDSPGRRGTPLRGTPYPGSPQERYEPYGDGQTHGGRQGLAPADLHEGPHGSSHGGPDGGPLEAPHDDPSEDPRKAARRGGLGAWARRLTGARPAAERPGQTPAPAPTVWEEQQRQSREAAGAPADEAYRTAAERLSPEAADERWPDPATILLTALGPGPRLWERGPDHPDALTVRLGTAPQDGGRSAAPVTVELRKAGALGLAGPRTRLGGLARAAVAQLAALHSPATLEIVLLSTDRARSLEDRLADWSWLGWLPQVRPAHSQDCRLLLAYDKEQAAARTAELARRLDDGPLGPQWAAAERSAVASAAARYNGPYTLLIVDGDPGSPALRETTARLAASGPAAGIHVLCLAETPAATPAFPLASTYEAARAASPAFGECGAVAVLSGDVATALRVVQPGTGPNGTVAAVDAVSSAWAERFARALAPLREADTGTGLGGRPARSAAVPLPDASRLLDELGLARATPASLMARWAAASDTGRSGAASDTGLPGAAAVLGAGPHGPVCADLAADACHLLVTGGPGSGKTELLRSLAASLAAADRPDLLSLVLVDGAGPERGEGLRLCTDLPHVTTHLTASDPVRMRQFAQALSSELKRRAETLAGTDFAEWRAAHLPAPRTPAPRRSPEAASGSSLAERDGSSTGTLRLRARSVPGPGGEAQAVQSAPMPRLFVLVDDFDALVAPALGSTGRPAAGSVVRALEAVAREGAALGVHLIAATGHPDRTSDTATDRAAGLRVELGPAADAAEPVPPGRGRLHRAADSSVTPFQAGRVTGRIPRTSTLRPTVVPLEWERMGDPPARRPLRELGNGPTDLALLASALQRAAQSCGAPAVPPLL
ncbi:cell division protein FtsK [Streptomyces rimosus subsp. pseudoverticillatus]|uniref:FtsK/SpoIIIE domain-containing protein n=1 Tax=Streptomyces rimosus TaxID=1927 RepID=UPI0006B29FB2|nr:FtsK/SpoIIIE domain-containing protein [Streptomyces rimosus]KOT79622.1 cell division protein FtsK [Streptomyces rimosus subsp. pseudoverticillatus]